MYVKNHVGINNAFVTGYPLYVNVDILAGTPAYYASQYPFFSYGANFKICKTGTLAFGSTSTFDNVKFR